MENVAATADSAPPRTPYRPLAWLAVAAGLGIAADLALHSRLEASLFAVWWIGAAVALVYAEYAGRRQHQPWATAALLIAVGGAGAAWHHFYWNEFPADDLGRFASEESQPTCVTGVLTDRVRISPPADRSPLRALPAQTISETTLEVEQIRDGAKWRTAGGVTRLRVAGELHGVAIGDRVTVFAQLGQPLPPLNPGEYDWQAHERRFRRNSELYCDHIRCVTLVSDAPSTAYDTWLAGIRSWCERQLTATVPTRDAPLVLATLLGDQERLSESTKDAFLNTGAIHLLVVSGAHVALLASIVWWVVQGTPLSNGWRLTLMLGTVGVYALIVGLQPSVTRATILTMMMLAALFIGRVPSMGNVLGVAAIVVCALNPSVVSGVADQISEASPTRPRRSARRGSSYFRCS